MFHINLNANLMVKMHLEKKGIMKSVDMNVKTQ